MFAAYGVDVLDPAVTLRRIWVLLQRLPPAARRGGEQWSAESELLALVADHLAHLTYVTLKANGAKNVRKPAPVPRPGDRGRRRPVPPPAEAPGPRRALSWTGAVEKLSVIPGAVIEDS